MKAIYIFLTNEILKFEFSPKVRQVKYCIVLCKVQSSIRHHFSIVTGFQWFSVLADKQHYGR